jgi:hypothetical protein
VNNDLEQLARHRIEERAQRNSRGGIRRSARLIALDIRASRRHAR